MKNRIDEILQGFKEYLGYFEKVKNADKYSIYNYILKPDDMKILIEYIEKLRSEIK